MVLVNDLFSLEPQFDSIRCRLDRIVEVLVGVSEMNDEVDNLKFNLRPSP